MEAERKESGRSGRLHYRRIVLADGRYMIFYTFDDDEPDTALDPQTEQQPEEENV